MQLEDGDYFLTDQPEKLEDTTGAVHTVPDLFEGVVFKALIVSGNWVACEVIERTPKEEKPYVISLKWIDRNVQTVSKAYAQCIKDSRRADEEPKGALLANIFGDDALLALDEDAIEGQILELPDDIKEADDTDEVDDTESEDPGDTDDKKE